MMSDAIGRRRENDKSHHIHRIEIRRKRKTKYLNCGKRNDTHTLNCHWNRKIFELLMISWSTHFDWWASISFPFNKQNNNNNNEKLSVRGWIYRVGILKSTLQLVSWLYVLLCFDFLAMIMCFEVRENESNGCIDCKSKQSICCSYWVHKK